MYSAFISYRKTSSVNADYIRQCISDNSSYAPKDIFLDKHNIGPEAFDEKLKTAIAESNCFILLVTAGCFKPKDDGETDWFLEEIRTAISLKKRIIPLLFDNIRSLSEKDIAIELAKSFSSQELTVLKQAQSIPYSIDFPEASISKLVTFVEEANKTTSIAKKALIALRIVGFLLIVFALFFSLCFGIGFLWGYFTSSTDTESVLRDNTIISGNNLHYEYAGWDATYDLDRDTILIDVSDYSFKPKIRDIDQVLTCFTFSGSWLLLKKNIAYLRYIKILRGGSKPAKVAFVVASIAACVGAFCGFSQGSSFGKSKRQQETALKIYPLLQYRSTWLSLISKNPSLIWAYNRRHALKNPNLIPMVKPQNDVCPAYKAGITGEMILLKFNSWEIGESRYDKLSDIIENSRDVEKQIVWLNTEEMTVIEARFPKGVAGMEIYPGDNNQETFEMAVQMFHDWEQCQ